jgi:hypothetical protein
MRRTELLQVYVIDLARNARLHRIVAPWGKRVARRFARRQEKQRSIHEFQCAAGRWDKEQRIVTRLEFGSHGINPRFIVTNLDRPAEALYDDLYCQRGEAHQPEGRRTAEGWSREAGCGNAA